VCGILRPDKSALMKSVLLLMSAQRNGTPLQCTVQ